LKRREKEEKHARKKKYHAFSSSISGINNDEAIKPSRIFGFSVFFFFFFSFLENFLFKVD